MVLQRVVEPALDAGETRIVDPGVADDMRRERAVGVDAAFLVLELHSRNTELIDLILLARR